MTGTLWKNARIVTLAGGTGWDPLVQYAIVTEHGTIRWLGTFAICRRTRPVGSEHDLDRCVLVTPGLVELHVHLVYAGARAREFELRLQGATYEAIARAGGGIRSTVAATRAASGERLYLWPASG